MGGGFTLIPTLLPQAQLATPKLPHLTCQSGLIVLFNLLTSKPLKINSTSLLMTSWGPYGAVLGSIFGLHRPPTSNPC